MRERYRCRLADRGRPPAAGLRRRRGRVRCRATAVAVGVADPDVAEPEALSGPHVATHRDPDRRDLPLRPGRRSRAPARRRRPRSPVVHRRRSTRRRRERRRPRSRRRHRRGRAPSRHRSRRRRQRRVLRPRRRQPSRPPRPTRRRARTASRPGCGGCLPPWPWRERWWVPCSRCARSGAGRGGRASSRPRARSPGWRASTCHSSGTAGLSSGSPEGGRSGSRG
jgi:hypothetical protein